MNLLKIILYKIYKTFLTFFIIFFLYLVIDIVIFFFLPSEIKNDLFVNRAHRIKSYYYHHDLRSNASYKDSWGYNNYLVHTNNLGFKDKSIRDVNFKEKNILFIGDSFTEGVGLKFDETYVGIISEKLKKNNSNIEILNAGVQSYSPKIYYAKLFDIIERKDLPINHIVLMISGGDFFDDKFRYGKISKDNILYHEDFQNKYFIEIINFIKGNTLFYQFIVKITPPKVILEKIQSLFTKKKNIENNYKKEFSKKEILSMSFMHIKDIQYLYDDKVFENWGKEAINESTEVLEKIAEFLKKKNITLDILYIEEARLILEKPKADKKFYLINNLKNIEKFNNVRFNFINEYHGDYDDKFNAYKSLFFIGDIHWNDKGNKKVADEILKKINF